jgi:hypothetical protein
VGAHRKFAWTLQLLWEEYRAAQPEGWKMVIRPGDVAARNAPFGLCLSTAPSIRRSHPRVAPRFAHETKGLARTGSASRAASAFVAELRHFAHIIGHPAAI